MSSTVAPVRSLLARLLKDDDPLLPILLDTVTTADENLNRLVQMNATNPEGTQVAKVGELYEKSNAVNVQRENLELARAAREILAELSADEGKADEMLARGNKAIERYRNFSEAQVKEFKDYDRAYMMGRTNIAREKGLKLTEKQTEIAAATLDLTTIQTELTRAQVKFADLSVQLQQKSLEMQNQALLIQQQQKEIADNQRVIAQQNLGLTRLAFITSIIALILNTIIGICTVYYRAT